MKNDFLKHLVKSLSIFYDTFNQRPVSHTNKIPELYYSEKLLTKIQLEDYEKACKELEEYFKDVERIQDELTNSFQHSSSAVNARIREELPEVGQISKKPSEPE